MTKHIIKNMMKTRLKATKQTAIEFTKKAGATGILGAYCFASACIIEQIIRTTQAPGYRSDGKLIETLIFTSFSAWLANSREIINTLPIETTGKLELETMEVVRYEEKKQRLTPELEHGLIASVHGNYNDTNKDGKDKKDKTENEPINILFMGVIHEIEYASEHSKRIIKFMQSKEKQTILCSEYPVLPTHLSECLPQVQRETHGYFQKIVDDVHSARFKIAIIEGHIDTNGLVKNSILGTLASDLILLVGGVNAAQMIFGTNEIPFPVFASLALLYVYSSYKNQTKIWNGKYASMDPLIPDNIGKSLYRLFRNSEWILPIIEYSRNLFYAAAIRKLMDDGFRDFIVLTGNAHTFSIIQHLTDLEPAIPVSECFRKDIFLIEPDGTDRKIRLR